MFEYYFPFEEWEFRVTGKDFFFVGRVFEGDENAATLFTQHTSLLAHNNAVQHGSDLVCSSKDRLCAVVVVVVVVGIGGRRSTRAHTQRRSRHAQTEREREREREKETRIYRTTTTPPKSNYYKSIWTTILN